jgi:hypothetical protein
MSVNSDAGRFSHRGGYGDAVYPSDSRSPGRQGRKPHRAGYPVDATHPAAQPAHHPHAHHSMAYHHGSTHAMHGGPENPWAESQAGPFGARPPPLTFRMARLERRSACSC